MKPIVLAIFIAVLFLSTFTITDLTNFDAIIDTLSPGENTIKYYSN